MPSRMLPQAAPTEAQEERTAPRRFSGPVPADETPTQLRGAVLRLAWPSIVENALQSLLQIATTAMVSRLGATAIAGVGVSNQVLIVAISTFFAISVGTTVMVAFNVGARKPEEASLAAKQSFYLGLALAGIITTAGLLFAPQFIALLGAEPEVVREGGAFLRIESLGTVFLVTMLICSGILRGTGDTRTPMLVTGGINIVNIAVSIPLIFGVAGVPGFGVYGAAWGNIIARAIGTAILFSICWRGRQGVRLRGRQGWAFDLAAQRRLVALGLPNFLESLFRSGGMVIFAAAVVSLGTTAFAAQQVANLFWQMALFPSFGFATAAMTLTGQSLGAGLPERAQKVTWVAVRYCVLWMTLAGIVYFLFGYWLVLPFSTGDPQIRQIASDALKVICFSQPIQAVGITLAGGLRGAGDTRWPMFTTGLAMWFVRVPAAWILGVALGFGIPGAYIGLILDAAVILVLNLYRYRSGLWLKARTLAASPAS